MARGRDSVIGRKRLDTYKIFSCFPMQAKASASTRSILLLAKLLCGGGGGDKCARDTGKWPASCGVSMLAHHIGLAALPLATYTKFRFCASSVHSSRPLGNERRSRYSKLSSLPSIFFLLSSASSAPL